MIYLIIMFSVAAVGIASLWVQQRRERSHLESSERFLESLQKISPDVQPVRRGRKRPVQRSTARHRSAQRSPRRTSSRPTRAEIERREAARRRVEARRRAQRGPARSRAVS